MGRRHHDGRNAIAVPPAQLGQVVGDVELEAEPRTAVLLMVGVAADRAEEVEVSDGVRAFPVEILFVVQAGADVDTVVRSGRRVGPYVIDSEDGTGRDLR